jgi:hypothetical protein
MPLEENLTAARNANAHVNARLGIQSSNRPSDVRAPGFMTELELRKSTLTEQVIAEKKLAKENVLQQQIALLTLQLQTHKKHIATLRMEQRTLGESLGKLEGNEKTQAQEKMALLGKQSVSLMSEDHRLDRELKKNQEALEKLSDLNQRENIEVTAHAAMDVKKGNCDEMSSIAYLFLRIRGTRPIDLFETMAAVRGVGEDAVEDSHQFVVIGRQGNQNRNSPDTWSADAVICDPWANEAYQAASLHEKLRALGYETELVLRMRDEHPGQVADEP